MHLVDVSLLSDLHIGDSATVRIDTDRSARLMLSHTASPILYVAVGMNRLDAVQATLSCHIRIDGARFYFDVHARFTPEQIRQIQACANDLILRNAANTISAHSQEPDLRSWHCEHKSA